jgi:glycosyltransferase involved in cell wall biosynthesis
MRMGFIGNTNNFPFTLARAVRRKGHDVVFFVDSSARLCRPEHRYHDIGYPYPEWIRDVGSFNLLTWALPNPRRRRLIAELRNCDVVVTNGLATSLIPRIGKPAFVILTGSDLEYSGDLFYIDRPKMIPWKPRWFWNLVSPALVGELNRIVIPAQRAGMQSAVGVSYFPKGLIPNGDRLLEEIGVDEKRRVFFMMAELEETHFESPPHNEPPRIFCATRFTWRKPLRHGFCDLDDKGSDVMIRGLGMFYRQTGRALNIRFVKKGIDVAETRELVESEGIGGQVTWLDEMSQNEVRNEFRAADIVFEQLGTSVIGMAGLDAMAVGRPVIADGRPEIMNRVTRSPSPVCQARTPEEVAAQLSRLMNPREREVVGRLSRSYVEENFSPDSAADTFIGILTAGLKRTVTT